MRKMALLFVVVFAVASVVLLFMSGALEGSDTAPLDNTLALIGLGLAFAAGGLMFFVSEPEKKSPMRSTHPNATRMYPGGFPPA